MTAVFLLVFSFCKLINKFLIIELVFDVFDKHVLLEFEFFTHKTWNVRSFRICCVHKKIGSLGVFLIAYILNDFDTTSTNCKRISVFNEVNSQAMYAIYAIYPLDDPTL